MGPEGDRAHQRFELGKDPRVVPGHEEVVCGTHEPSEPLVFAILWREPRGKLEELARRSRRALRRCIGRCLVEQHGDLGIRTFRCQGQVPGSLFWIGRQAASRWWAFRRSSDTASEYRTAANSE